MQVVPALVAALAALALAPSALAAPALVTDARTAPLLSGSAAAKAKPPQVVLRDLRVCGRAAYQASSYRCLRDERGRAVVSEAALCTLRIEAYSAVTVRAKMLFAGGTQYSYTRKIRKRTRFQLAFGVEFPATMPAGSFTCRFTVGKEKASATLRSGGPAGPVVWSAVCLPTALRSDGSGCAADAGTAPVASTSAVSCSAWMVGQHGKRVAVELFSNDNGSWTRIDGAELAMPRPISVASVTVPSPLGAPFAPGQYACRYSVAGRPLGEKHFTLL